VELPLFTINAIAFEIFTTKIPAIWASQGSASSLRLGSNVNVGQNYFSQNLGYLGVQLRWHPIFAGIGGPGAQNDLYRHTTDRFSVASTLPDFGIDPFVNE
jgi:hypothetical protein